MTNIESLLSLMKEIVHREYFNGMKEMILITSIEQWMKDSYRQGTLDHAEAVKVEKKEYPPINELMRDTKSTIVQGFNNALEEIEQKSAEFFSQLNK